MADEKITEMTDATQVSNLDLLPLVQAGDNVKATKAEFLRAASGESIVLQNAPAEYAAVLGDSILTGVFVRDKTVAVAGETNVLLQAPSPTSTSTIYVQGNGIIVTPCDDGTFTINHHYLNQPLFVVDVSGAELRITNLFSVQIQLTDIDPGNWSGTPALYSQAIDRLAAAVAGLLSGPIP